eukprot:19849_1
MAILLYFALTILWFIVPVLSEESCPHDKNFTIGTAKTYIKYCQSDLPSSTNARAIFAIHASGEKYVHSYHWITTAVRRISANDAAFEQSMRHLMIVAPQFPSSEDKSQCSLDSKQACWNTWPYWSWGYNSNNTQGANKISSFDIMDKLIENITNNENIKTAVVIGHSAGAQFVQRYALMNKLSDNTNKNIHFIAVNPSTYAYPMKSRWIDSEFRVPTITEQKSCNKQMLVAIHPPDVKIWHSINGTKYNNWPFGLVQHTNDLSKGEYIKYKLNSWLKRMALKSRYKKQRVTYIAGSVDVCPESGNINDVPGGVLNCNLFPHDYRRAPYTINPPDSAEERRLKLQRITGKLSTANPVCFQGKNRMERAVNFVRALEIWKTDTKKTHKLILVPLVAHSLSLAIRHKHIANLIINGPINMHNANIEYNDNMDLNYYGYDKYEYNNYDGGYDNEDDEYIGEYNYMDALNDLLEDELELEKKK